VSEEIRVSPKSEFEYYAAPTAVLELETEAEIRERKLTQSANSVSDDQSESEE
jgi:hypothetical protein